jgi:hypothetical protein
MDGEGRWLSSRPYHLSFPVLSSGKSKEAEIKRINKELANIRSKFKGRLGTQIPGCEGRGRWGHMRSFLTAGPLSSFLCSRG